VLYEVEAGQTPPLHLPPQAAARLASARTVVVKVSAGYPEPYPVTSDPATVTALARTLRERTQADIYAVEGSSSAETMDSLFEHLGYRRPEVARDLESLGVRLIDAEEADLVEVPNPLPTPLMLERVWLPRLVAEADFKVSLAPVKLLTRLVNLSVKNLIGLLPRSRYRGRQAHTRGLLHLWGLSRCLADIYFTCAFDLGIIDARRLLISTRSFTSGRIETAGWVAVGRPLAADFEALARLGRPTPSYLSLIDEHEHLTGMRPGAWI